MDLPIGEYEVGLNDGWALRRQIVAANGDITYDTIPASDRILTSPNPQSVQITEQNVSNVTFTFLVGDDVVSFGEGRLGVSATVEECADSESSACNAQCSDDTDCADLMVCDVASSQCVAEYGKLAAVTCGSSRTCGLDAAGQAYCWGYGLSGGLGVDPHRDANTPIPAQMPSGVKFASIAGRGYHSCALDTEGSAYCWGYNRYGQVGNNTVSTNNEENVPVAVVMPQDVTFASVEVGSYHSCALDRSGQAFCWGEATSGRLGHEGDGLLARPVSMPNGVSFKALTMGHDHSCALDTMGRAYCWGEVSEGQVGNGTSDSSVTRPMPATMPEGTSFTTLSAGTGHNCALDTEGQAYCWGQSFSGALGNAGASNSAYTPSPVSMPIGVSFSTIATGWSVSCALDTAGQAYCWGSSNVGQSGNGTLEDQLVPTPVSMPTGVSFAALSASGIGLHFCALSTVGDTYCWGHGDRGQLGNGGEADQSLPVKVIWE